MRILPSPNGSLRNGIARLLARWRRSPGAPPGVRSPQAGPLFRPSTRPLHSSPRAGRAFTLIELVITVAIVGILASVALPLGELVVKRSKEQELRTSLRQIREAIDAYKRAADQGKVERKADETGYPRTLDALVNGVEDMKSPGKSKIYFLRRLPRDPLYADADRRNAETWGKRSYASPPNAPSEGADVFDIYSLAPGIGLNGIPYKEW